MEFNSLLLDQLLKTRPVETEIGAAQPPLYTNNFEKMLPYVCFITNVRGQHSMLPSMQLQSQSVSQRSQLPVMLSPVGHEGLRTGTVQTTAVQNKEWELR